MTTISADFLLYAMLGVNVCVVCMCVCACAYVQTALLSTSLKRVQMLRRYMCNKPSYS